LTALLCQQYFQVIVIWHNANKIAALGENIVLLANLGGLALLYVFYFAKKLHFST
jgi:hypothetical protein